MRRFFFSTSMLFVTGVLFAMGGCATGELGSPCNGGPNEEGFCVEGTVCAPAPSTSEMHPFPPNADGAYCRALCDEPSDCADPGFECRAVEGSMLRACQPEL
jgi:hypothetical protein